MCYGVDIFAVVCSLYRIVVETLSPKDSSSRRRRRQSPVSEMDPCGLPSAEHVDYSMAEKLNMRCYIAAEIVQFDKAQYFIVGDGKTHGGYTNPPLQLDQDYRIWFGLVVTVDGVSRICFNGRHFIVCRFLPQIC